MECLLVLLAFLALPLLFVVGFENHVSVLRRCKRCVLNTRLSEKYPLLLDPRAPNLRPDTVWLRRRTARLWLTVNGHVLLDFHQNPDRPPQRLRVLSASLWLYVRAKSHPAPSAGGPNRTATLYIFRVPDSNSSAPLSSSMDLLSALEVHANPGWRRVDLRPAVQRWFASSEKLTLLVDCVGCGPSAIQVAQFERRQRRRPFLAVATEAAGLRRRGRRYTVTCGEGVTQCCKQSLYVSFEELGWDDWIIAPKGYYANYCMGECAGSPRTPDMFRYFHAHVLEEYRQRNPYASIAPCCAPTKLSPMSLIYFDRDQNIIKSDLPKMIVDDCGCT